MSGRPDRALIFNGGDRAEVFAGARPTHRGDLVVESHGMAPIPEDQRYGSSRRNFTVWFAPNMELSSVFTGTLAFTLGLGFWPGFVAIVIGVVLGAVPVGLLATLGPKTGMGQLPLARLPFGRGITLPAAVQWLSALAWDGLVGLFGAQGAQLLFHVPFAVGVLIVLALEGLVGFLGYEVIHQLETWGSAILAVLFVVLSVRILERGQIPLHSTVHGGAAIGAFVLMTTIAFSGAFSWASYAADYSRYQEKETPSSPIFWWTLGGLCASYIWTYAIGLAGARVLSNQTAAGVRSLVGGGTVGTLALVIVVFGAITSNAMNDYSGSLALQASGVRLKRNWSAASGTMIAFGVILWLHGGNTSARFQSILLFQRVLDRSISRNRPPRLARPQGHRHPRGPVFPDGSEEPEHRMVCIREPDCRLRCHGAFHEHRTARRPGCRAARRSGPVLLCGFCSRFLRVPGAA